MKMKNLLMTVIAILGLPIISNAQVPNYVPSNGLLGWYPFNGNTNDESASSNNASNQGAVLTNDRFGNSNKAYNFLGGTSSYIQTPLSSSVSTPSFTISCWAKCNTSVPNAPLIGSRNSLDRITGIIYFQEITKFSIATSNTTVDCFPSDNYFDSYWHHFVAKFDMNTSYIYFDGVLVSTCPQIITPLITAQFKIGLDDLTSFGDRGFIGDIDDIGFWNRALTEEEITSLYFGSALSINDVSKSNLFSVFPNPAQNQININLDPNLVGSVFMIYDISGKVVKKGKLNSENTTIELNDLSSGIYNFNLGGNRNQAIKVIKE